MDVTNTPRLAMIYGQPFSQVWQLKNDDGTPVDLSDYEVSAAFYRDRTLIRSVPLAVDDLGFLRLEMDSGAVDALSGARVTYEINLNAPASVNDQTWRGLVTVQ